MSKRLKIIYHSRFEGPDQDLVFFYSDPAQTVWIRPEGRLLFFQSYTLYNTVIPFSAGQCQMSCLMALSTERRSRRDCERRMSERRHVAKSALSKKKSKFPSYKTKCKDESAILHKIFHVISRFPRYILCYIS